MCVRPGQAASLDNASQDLLTQVGQGGSVTWLAREVDMLPDDRVGCTSLRPQGPGLPGEFQPKPKSRRRESDLKRSDRVGTQRRESPEGPVKRSRRKLPFLENSTACQKSTPDMLIPRLQHLLGRGSFETNTARTLCARGLFLLSHRSRGVAPDYRYTFTESLILAQDERWRRA